MSKTFTITVYSDVGHAWGKVKRDVLVNLGIADKISRYSYSETVTFISKKTVT